jgi:hypothetical protein
LRFVFRQSSGVTCDRWRSKTSIVASRSPPASSAIRIERPVSAVNVYQTEFFVALHVELSYGFSSVESTVVPRTEAGSDSDCAAARASFGGGAASAVGASHNSASVATTTDGRRTATTTTSSARRSL